MDSAGTTAAVQRYLDELAGVKGDSPAGPVIGELLGRSVNRLSMLCAVMLHRSYPRLTHPPLNLQSEELLSAIVERLLKALQKRHSRAAFDNSFAPAQSKHIRWELNDFAQRLDEKMPVAEFVDELVPAPISSSSGISLDGRRMLNAIENLPDEEREVFSLIRIQGMTYVEAAEIASVSSKTIQRRLNRSLILLSKSLADLRPSAGLPDES